MSRKAFTAVLFLLLPATASAQHEESPLSGRLFADLNYITSERSIAQGFRLGQLVAHGRAALTEKLAFFGEATASATATGYATEIERSVIRYDFSDKLKVSAGRFHTPIGHWNTAYHHGVWLQPTSSRPEMLRGDRPLFPIHLVGLMLEGAVETRLAGLSYTAGVGNGRTTLPQRAGDAGDANPNRASLASVTLYAPAMRGLRVGASTYNDLLSVQTLGFVREQLTAAHVVYDAQPLEFIAEGMQLRHKQRGAGTPSATESHAAYALLAYRLPGAASSFRPYARYDRISPATNDLVFGTTPMESSGWLAGVRYDFHQLAALKMEFRRERLVTRTWSNTAALQLTFTFPGAPTSRAHVVSGHEASTVEGR